MRCPMPVFGVSRGGERSKELPLTPYSDSYLTCDVCNFFLFLPSGLAQVAEDHTSKCLVRDLKFKGGAPRKWACRSLKVYKTKGGCQRRRASTLILRRGPWWKLLSGSRKGTCCSCTRPRAVETSLEYV